MFSRKFDDSEGTSGAHESASKVSPADMSRLKPVAPTRHALPEGFDTHAHEKIIQAGMLKPITRAELSERIQALKQQKQES